VTVKRTYTLQTVV